MTSIAKVLKAAMLLAFIYVAQGFVANDAAAQIAVGFTDAELLLVNMPEYKGVGEKVQSQAASVQEALQSKMTVFQEDVSKFEKQASLLPDATRTQRESELSQRYVALQQEGAQAEAEVAQFEAELLNPLITRINEAVNAVAAEKGLDIVLTSGAILYINPETITDITLDVAKRVGIKISDETAANSSN